MNYEDFVKLVNERQATRSFNDKEISEELLNKIVSVGRLTPSACNSQPWKMYVASEKGVVDKVRKSLQAENRNMFLDSAKAFIVLSEVIRPLKPDVEKRLGKSRFVKYDIGELCAYLTLTAKSLGIDSCIIGWIDIEALRDAVGMSENEDCNVVIALGYSDVPLREKSRLSLDEIVKFN